MAIDNTPPRLKLIVTIAAITVITLVSLDFVFKSYYAMMTDEATREKIAPTRDKDEQHKAETAALTGAAVPIDQAIAQLGKGRPEAISPQPSDDLGPMTGWSKLPKPAPTPQPKGPDHAHPAHETGDGGTALAAGDGGAGHADGGAPHAGHADGGAAPAPAGGKDAGAAKPPAPPAPKH
jgi:hypothetical protein